MTMDVGRLLLRVAGVIALLGAWELAGRAGWLGTSFPPLSDIFGAFEGEASRNLFRRAILATGKASIIALAIGTGFALVLALVASTQPWSERGLDTMASSLYAVPTISFGPVFILLFGPANTAVLLGALSAYFPIYVALTSALRFAPSAYDDLAHVLGASKSKAFLFLKLPHSVPAFVDGLRLGAPAAVLGVILGEWFGASRGLGIVIISSLQNVRIAQLWAAACLSIACTFGAYLLLTGLYHYAHRRFSW